jgi:hypothetical protein
VLADMLCVMASEREPIYRLAERAAHHRADGSLRRVAKPALIALGALAMLAYFSGPQFW